MNADNPYWYIVVVVGGGLLAIWPALPFVTEAPGSIMGYLIGTMGGISVQIYVSRLAVNWITDRVDVFPGVMTPRAYSLATAVSYMYVGWNIGVLFPVSPGTMDPSLVVVAYFYTGLLAAITLIGKIAVRQVNATYESSTA